MGAYPEVQAPSISAVALGYFIVRLALGACFIVHGAQLLFGAFGGGGVEGTTAMFGKMGMPAPRVMAILAGGTQFFGGLAVLTGILTRLASLGLIVVMLVAIVKVHLPHGYLLNSPTGQGYEYNVALIAMSLLLLLTGPGPWSVDHDWEGRKLLRGGATRPD
jgi:putative oxidoreductase